MRQNPLFLSTMLIAILLLAGNCRKADISFESEAITFSLSGRVLDKDNQPVNQAEVKIGSGSALTDIDGYFRLNGVRAPKDAAYVTVTKNGYFSGSRTFSATPRAVNFINIRLIPKEITGSFTAASGGLVNLTSGGAINFQPNSVVDATTNNAYSGIVSISSFFIDPTDPGFTSIMPGDLRGITASNEERGLQSFGMMAVELSGAGGQKLQLASGKSATVSFPIPAGLRGQAPATIPLWSFDEVKGMWKEEGSATKQGDHYVGTISHFSFWNCDAPFPVVDFEAVIKDQQGNPVINAQVNIKVVSSSAIGYGRTDSTGRVRGKVPSNEPLELKVFDRCYTLIHSQNMGPFSGNTNLGTITVNYQPPGVVTITGTVVNCNNNPVVNGYVGVYLDGIHNRANINNGTFSITINRCNGSPAQAQLVAVDIGGNAQGPSVSVPVTSGTANAGQISACGVSLTEFINYSIDAVNYSFTPPDSLTCFHNTQSFPAVTAVMGMNITANRHFTLQFSDFGSAGQVVTNLDITHGNVRYKKDNSQQMVVTVTQFGNPGEFIAGHFTGNVVNGTTVHSFTCNFRVRRQF